MNAGARIALCLIVFRALEVGALDRSEVTFYAGFEDTVTANTAAGQATPLTRSTSRFTEGIIGKGVVTEGRIRYAYKDNVTPAESTISFWIRPIGWQSRDLKAGQYNFLTVHGSPAMQITQVYWGVTRFYMYYPRETKATNVFRYYGFAANRWYHFAAIWKSGVEAQFFINGVRVGIITENVTTVTSGINFSIGAPRTVFDELIILNRALKLEEVRALYFRGLVAPR